MKLWLKNPLSILAENAGGGIVVDGTNIVELVPSGVQPSLPYDSVFDASSHIILPGLINLHHHFYQTLTRVFPAALNKDLFPSLAQENIHFLHRDKWNKNVIEWTKSYFHDEVIPVVSPLGLDPAHPFPRLVNKSLNFILSLDGKDAFGRDSGLAVVPAPRSLPRLIKVPEEIMPEGDNFVFLSSIIHAYVEEFFPGMTVSECHQFSNSKF